jgi:hypothetical protein
VAYFSRDLVARRLRIIVGDKRLWSSDVRYLNDAIEMLENDVDEKSLRNVLRPLLVRFGVMISGKPQLEVEALVTRAENMSEEELDAELRRMLDERKARREQAQADKEKEKDHFRVIAVTPSRRVTLACGHRYVIPEGEELMKLGDLVLCAACKAGGEYART